MRTPPPLLARLSVVALLTVGLVGMHHLVVAACHHLGVSAAHGIESVGHDHAAAPLVPSPEVPADEPPLGGGLASAAATCLAVLLMVVSLVLPSLLGRARRWHYRREGHRLSRLTPRICDPPDLVMLSVSRT